MRARTALLLAATLAALAAAVQSCDEGEVHFGCKLSGGSCMCGYGCKSDYVFRSRRACTNALRGESRHRSSNFCHRQPCMRGICIQTTLEPGYTCRCEGTGFYGQRCERACPTFPMRGLEFPHECVII